MADNEDNKTPMEGEETTIALEDQVKDLFMAEGHEVVMDIQSKFDESKTNRRDVETRWLKAYNNFRARYGDDVKFLETEKSRVFVKVTKTKVIAAYGQILDIITGGPRFPIAIRPTEDPLGIEEVVHLDPNEVPNQTTPEPATIPEVDPVGYEGDGLDMMANDTWMSRTARAVKKAMFMEDTGKELKINKGPATQAGQITLSPAEEAARI